MGSPRQRREPGHQGHNLRPIRQSHEDIVFRRLLHGERLFRSGREAEGSPCISTERHRHGQDHYGIPRQRHLPRRKGRHSALSGRLRHDKRLGRHVPLLHAGLPRQQPRRHQRLDWSHRADGGLLSIWRSNRRPRNQPDIRPALQIRR